MNGLQDMQKGLQNILDKNNQKAINLTWFISKFEGQEHFSLTTKHKKGLYLLQTFSDNHLWTVDKEVMVNGHYKVYVVSERLVDVTLRGVGYVWVGRVGTWENRG